jgi:hypothetical protein
MPDPHAILADITAELEERGVQPRPHTVIAQAADRGVDVSVIEALAERLAETEAAT